MQRLENLKGVERVGEEEVNGRKADSIVRHDFKYKTHRLDRFRPRRSCMLIRKLVYRFVRSCSPKQRDVKGVKGAHIVAEFRDISTTVDDSLFEIPAGMNKVSPEQVRQQINAVTSTLAAVAKAMMSNMQGSAPSTSASPATTTSPTPRP